MFIGNQTEKAAQALLTGMDLRERHTAGFVVVVCLFYSISHTACLKITQPWVCSVVHVSDIIKKASRCGKKYPVCDQLTFFCSVHW